jgi:hypothetical protein
VLVIVKMKFMIISCPRAQTIAMNVRYVLHPWELMKPLYFAATIDFMQDVFTNGLIIK